MTDLKNNLEEFLIEHKNVKITFNKNRDYTSLEKMIEYSKQLEQELRKKSNMLAKVKSYFGISVRKNSEMRQELQKTREQLSKAEQRIFHLGECPSLWEYQGICDCGYEQYFKDKQGE